MQTIQLEHKASAAGILSIPIPRELRDQNLEVIVVLNSVQPLTQGIDMRPRDDNGWPIGWLDSVYGCLSDDPLERLPQGEAEVRDAIL